MEPIHSEQEIIEIEGAIKQLELVLNGFKSVHDLKEKELVGSEKFLIDSKLILTLYAYDVFVLYKGMGLAKSKLEAKMMSRYLSMIMYGFCRDISNVLGNRFTQNMKLSFGNYDFTEEINPFRKRLNEFKLNFENHFKEVRNNVVAHRDKDPHKQFDIIEQIKLVTFTDSYGFFIPFNQELDKYFYDLLVRIEQQK